MYFLQFDRKLSWLVDRKIQASDGTPVPCQVYLPINSTGVGTVICFGDNDQLHDKRETEFVILPEVKRRKFNQYGYLSKITERRSSVQGLDVFDKSSLFYTVVKPAHAAPDKYVPPSRKVSVAPLRNVILTPETGNSVATKLKLAPVKSDYVLPVADTKVHGDVNPSPIKSKKQLFRNQREDLSPEVGKKGDSRDDLLKLMEKL